ncbi:MAG TPA: aldolase/citrate lyase family protein [Bacteroidales bacterium]|nr:aldolase/citrate lyase family protein [Bacteroidales bacterium]
MDKITTTGNAGPKVRSDCEITLEIKSSGGISIDLKSKVKALYCDSITSECLEILEHFKIKNATLQVSDSGALPFVIAARLEAAIARLTGSEIQYLPEKQLPDYGTEKERFRFSRLYLPGNNPSLMINAGLHSADGIILDLEDSVAPERKDEARILVRNALRQVDFCGAERMVRINQGIKGIEDLKYVIPHNVNLILVPKCESGEEIKAVVEEISSLRKSSKQKNPVWLMPIIESAKGVESCYEIITSSHDVVAVAIGLEDYTSDIGVQRTSEGRESLYARTRIVNAAKAARIQPIDSVYSDVADNDGLRRNVQESKALGFEGMGCIHPRQIAVIREGFSPSQEEIGKASKIVLAFEEASGKGLGVVALGSKMIDQPVVNRALRTINLAVKLGMLGDNWRAEAAGEDH